MKQYNATTKPDAHTITVRQSCSLWHHLSHGHSFSARTPVSYVPHLSTYGTEMMVPSSESNDNINPPSHLFSTSCGARSDRITSYLQNKWKSACTKPSTYIAISRWLLRCCLCRTVLSHILTHRHHLASRPHKTQRTWALDQAFTLRDWVLNPEESWMECHSLTSKGPIGT